MSRPKTKATEGKPWPRPGSLTLRARRSATTTFNFSHFFYVTVRLNSEGARYIPAQRAEQTTADTLLSSPVTPECETQWHLDRYLVWDHLAPRAARSRAIISELVRIADLPGRRRLRSSSSLPLLVPPFRLTTVLSVDVHFQSLHLYCGTHCHLTSKHLLLCLFFVSKNISLFVSPFPI